MAPKEKPKSAPPGARARESLGGKAAPKGPPLPRRPSVGPPKIGALAPPPKTPPRPQRASLQVLGKVAGLAAHAKANAKRNKAKARTTIQGIPGEIIVTPPRSQQGSDPDDEPENIGRNASTSDHPNPPPKQMALPSLELEGRDLTPRTLNLLREENSALQAGIESRDSMIVDLNRRVSTSESAHESMQRNLVPKVNELIDRFERREEDQALRMQECEALESLEAHRMQECEEKNHVLYEELQGLQSQASELTGQRVPQVHTSELEAELASARHDELLAVEAMAMARTQLADKKEAMEEISQLTEQGMLEARAKLNEALRESAMYEEDAVAERCECLSLAQEVHTFRSEISESKALENEGARAALGGGGGGEEEEGGGLGASTGDVVLGAPWLSRWARLAVMLRLDCCGEVMCQAANAASRSKASASREASVNGDIQALDSMMASVQDAKALLVMALQETEAECAFYERQARFHEAKAASRLKDIDQVKEKEERCSKQILALKMQVAALRTQLGKSKIDMSGLSDREQVEAIISQEKGALQDAEEVAARSMVEQFAEARTVSEELERARDMEEEEASALIKVRDELQAYMDGQEAVLAGAALQPLIEEVQEAHEAQRKAIEEYDDEGLLLEAQTCRLYSQLGRSAAELKELRLEMEAAQQESAAELEQVREDLTTTLTETEENSTSKLKDELSSSTKALASMELEKDELQEALVMGVMADGQKDNESEVRQLSSALTAQTNTLKKIEAESRELREALVSNEKAVEEVQEGEARAEAAAESKAKAMTDAMAEVREFQVLEGEASTEAKFAQDTMQKALAEIAEHAQQRAAQEIALEASRLEIASALQDKEQIKEELTQVSLQKQDELLKEASTLEAAAAQQKEELLLEASSLETAAYQQREDLAEEACKIQAAVELQAEQLGQEEAKAQELEVLNCSLRMALASAEDAQENMKTEAETNEASKAEIAQLKREIEEHVEELREAARSKEDLHLQIVQLKSSLENHEAESRESQTREAASQAFADAQEALQSMPESDMTPSMKASLIRFKASMQLAETEMRSSLEHATAEAAARIQSDGKLRKTEFELQLATKAREAVTVELNQCLVNEGAAVPQDKAAPKRFRDRSFTFSEDEKDDKDELADAREFAALAVESRDEALTELSESLPQAEFPKSAGLLGTVTAEVEEEKIQTSIVHRILQKQRVASEAQTAATVALRAEMESMKTEDAALREELLEKTLKGNCLEQALQKIELVACTAEKSRDEALTELAAQEKADSSSATPGALGSIADDSENLGNVDLRLMAVRTLILRIEVIALVARPAAASSALIDVSKALLRSSPQDSLFTASPAEVAALRLQLEDELSSKTQIVALRSALQKRIEETSMSTTAECEEISILQSTAGVSPSLRLGRELQAHFSNKDRWAAEVHELREELEVAAIQVRNSEDVASAAFADGKMIDYAELQMYMAGTDDPKIGESVVTTATRAAMAAQAAAIRSASHFNLEASRLRIELMELVESLPPDSSLGSIEALASLLNTNAKGVKPFQLQIDLEQSVAAIRDAQEAALYAMDCISMAADPAQMGQISHLRKALQLLAREALKHIEEFQRIQESASEQNGTVASLTESGEQLQGKREDSLQLPTRMEPSEAGLRATPPPNDEILLLHFPSAKWPAPPNFQAILRKGLTALGSRHMAEVVIRLHEGSIIAELIGPRVAITELRGLPLMDLVICDYHVGLVRTSRPMLSTSEKNVSSPTRMMPSPLDRSLPVERELIGELQAAEMKAEVLLEASKADDIEFDELTTRLSVEEHAFQGSKDTCASLVRALESSEQAVQQGAKHAESQVRIYNEELQQEELRSNQLRLVVQDMAGTEISTHNELRGKLSLEEAQVTEFKQRLASLEGWTTDPRDTSRSAISIGIEIQGLMQRQELAAHAMSETIARGGDSVRVAVAASQMACLADETSGKVATIKRLVADAELRFSEALRKQRQNCFNWEVVAEQRQAHNELLQATLENPGPSALDDELRTEIAKCTQWEAIAGENEELVAHLHLARQEAERGKSSALAAEARFEHLIQEELMHETVQALAVAQVVDESVSAARSNTNADNSGDLAPNEFMEAVQMVAEAEAREAAKARQMSARVATEEASVGEMRAEMVELLNSAEESGTLQRKMHELQQLVDAAQRNEIREVDSTRELAMQLSAEQILATQMKSELSSMEFRLETAASEMQPEIVALQLQLAERAEVCEGLRDVAREQMVQVDSKDMELHARIQACADLEIVTQEMQTQIDLLTRRFSEHEISAEAFETAIEVELRQAQTEQHRASRLEIEEADQFRSEVAQCHSMGVELATALAGHATALCDAKLSAAKATADHDEESEKLSALVTREACMARELVEAKMDLEQEIEKHIYEDERWEMVLARHEGRAQVLHDVATDRQSEITALRNRLYVEERSCWMVGKATEDALFTLGETARLTEVKTELHFLSEAEISAEKCIQSKLRAEIEELRISLAAKAYSEDLAPQACFGDPDFVEDIQEVGDQSTIGHSPPSPIDVKMLHNSEEAELLQTLAFRRVQEAEAAEAYAQQRFEELQTLALSGANELEEDYDTPHPWVGLLSSNTIGREAAFAAIEDENEMVGEELQQVIAELQALHEEVRTPSTVFPGLSASDGRVETPKRNLSSPGMMDSPSSIQDVSTLAQRAHQLAHASAARHQNQLKALSGECAHWKECSSRQEACVEHLKEAIAASSAEAHELSAFLTVEEAAWRSLREATREKGTQELYEQFELEGVCAQLKQEKLDLEDQNQRLSAELNEANLKHEMDRGLQMELEDREACGAEQRADLEQALSRVSTEAEKMSVGLEVRLQNEISQIANIKARCRDELQSEARTCRESAEQMHTFMNDMQLQTSELIELHRLRDARTEMAEAQEEKMALAVQSESVENKQCTAWIVESAEMSTRLIQELQVARSDTEAKAEWSTRLLQELQEREAQKESSEARVASLAEKLERCEEEKQQAICIASEFQAEVTRLEAELRSASVESARFAYLEHEAQNMLDNFATTEARKEEAVFQVAKLQAELAEQMNANAEAAQLTQATRDEMQHFFWKLSAVEVDKEEAVSQGSALETEIVELRAAYLEATVSTQAMREETLSLHGKLSANDVDKDEAIAKASELQAEIVKFRTSSSEAAHTTQETTANMRAQVSGLFAQLDAWGAECASLERTVLAEEAIASELAASRASALSYQRHEAAESRSSRNLALASSEMTDLITSYSESPGTETHTAWMNLEYMLEDSDPVVFIDNRLLTCELDQRCANLQSELDEVRKTCIPHPAFSRLAVQMEALKHSKDRLFAALPDGRTLEIREDQLVKCKGMLLSMLPKVTSLAAQVNELRESRDSLLAEQHDYQSKIASRMSDELREIQNSWHAEHHDYRCKLATELGDELRESRDSLHRQESMLKTEFASALDDELRESRNSLMVESRRMEGKLRDELHVDTIGELEVELKRSQAEVESLEEVARMHARHSLSTLEIEAELKRSQAEVESLEQVAELHAQHSLKVHRLMCEDQHQRLTGGERSIGSQRYPARSGALRAWQASLADQSQALLERSWQLLNNSAPVSEPPTTLAIQQTDSSAMRSTNP